MSVDSSSASSSFRSKIWHKVAEMAKEFLEELGQGQKCVLPLGDRKAENGPFRNNDDTSMSVSIWLYNDKNMECMVHIIHIIQVTL